MELAYHVKTTLCCSNTGIFLTILYQVSALIYSQLHQVRHPCQVSHFDPLFPSKQENTKRHTIIGSRWQAWANVWFHRYVYPTET